MDPQLLSNASRLKDIYTTILLVYQRNKNQHGNSKWWKWLSLLKRSTLKLIDDIEELGSNIDIDGESCIKARATHIRTHIVPRCYIAFSTVAADKQFSTLGIVLVAILARFSKANPDEEEEHASSSAVDIRVPSYHAGAQDGEDMGEIVGRPADDAGHLSPFSASTDELKDNRIAVSRNTSKPGQELSAAKATRQKNKKKKQKRTNEIDDIFNSLV